MGVEKKLPRLLLSLLAISFVDVADSCFALLFLYYIECDTRRGHSMSFANIGNF